ncbi:MAG: hypothetical protein WC208_08465 [Gallionella sp.]|jgi:hypothetical protein
MIDVGKTVKVLSPVDGKRAVQFETGKVLYIGRRVLVEFFRNICGHDGNGIGRNRYCWMCDWDAVREA